jgi:hypothetical protein
MVSGSNGYGVRGSDGHGESSLNHPVTCASPIKSDGNNIIVTVVVLASNVYGVRESNDYGESSLSLPVT